MSENFKPNKYIKWKIYNVTPLKNKFGFRMILYFEDKTNKITQIGGFQNKKEAKKEREKIIAELYNGTYIADKQVTVSELLNYWVENEIKPKRKNNTYVAYSNAIKHINSYVGNIKLYNLNKGHIQKIYKKEASISVNVAKNVKTVINCSMHYAITQKLIANNPGKNLKLPEKLLKEAYRVRKIDVKRTLNINQVKTLIEASKDTKIHLQILFAVLMGLRKSEINGLKYTDIDYVHRTIKVQRQLGIVANTKKEDFKAKTYTKQEIELKSYSSYRELDIPDYVFEAILEERKIYESNRHRRINDKTTPFLDENYICCSTYGHSRSKDFHFKYWKQLLKDCNLPDIRFHNLRATYCTLLLKNNFNVKAISKLMGHAKEIITADVYGDTPEIIEDCLEELEPFIERVTPKSNTEDNEDFSNDVKVIEAIENYIKKLKIKNY